MASLLSTSFPWRAGNQFQLHEDGAQFFPRMLSAIQQAQHSISLEMYLCSSGKVFGKFRDALIAAAQRGVTVKLLLDGFGSLQVNTHDRAQLLKAGIELRFYNPISWRRGLKNLLRNHRKVLIVDKVIAFTGGAGLTDEFAGNDNTAAWHDVMLEIHGAVVTDWQRLFDRTWLGSLKIKLGQFNRSNASRLLQRITDENGRVVASFGPQAHHVLQSLHRQIKVAQRRAWIVTPYFMPSWKLRQRLIEAAHRGLDTRILVPGVHTDHPAFRQASHQYYAKLLHHGVRIFEYQPCFIHLKTALCDDWVSIGSTNFDRWNVRWNLDANQEVADIDFVTQLVTMLDLDFSHSIELRQQDWLLRPWYQRGMEWFIGLLERWSDWLK